MAQAHSNGRGSPEDRTNGLTAQASDITTLGAEPVAPTLRSGERPESPSHDREITRIGRFLVLRVLGQGAMGRVYAAYDEKLDRRVAIKVLHRGIDDASRRRALREAMAMAKLSHPNVVQVYEADEDHGEQFIAMELVRGQTLAQWQADPDRSWPEVLGAYLQAGEGLAAAHAAGLIHRDFKPHNAMVEQRGGDLRVRVLDFGIARVVDALGHPDSLTAGLSLDADLRGDLTSTGAVLGTPAYMAPEQFLGSKVGAAADQFSFCVALWEGLYRERPFAGETLPELMAAITTGEPREPSHAVAVPGWVRAAVLRGLSTDKAARHPSMEALLVALRGDRIRRRRRWWGLALGALGAVGLGVWGSACGWISAPSDAAGPPRSSPTRGGRSSARRSSGTS